MSQPSQRGSIFLEEAEIISHDTFPGDQFIIRLHAPKCAKTAQPGSFAHIQCDSLVPMRRPFSIMRASPTDGWVEFLYKKVGFGTQLLARKKRGATLSCLGPIGNPFRVDEKRRHALLIGGGVGIPPMIFLGESIRAARNDINPLVLMGSEVPFPFQLQRSKLRLRGLPDTIDMSISLLDDLNIPNRLASLQGYAGCHEGYITDLARNWLAPLDRDELGTIEIFACGPHAMLEAVACVARDFALPCQISLEEYMACAVGGCAGCVVSVKTENGPAMKRVCVDGPVFEARQIFH